MALQLQQIPDIIGLEKAVTCESFFDGVQVGCQLFVMTEGAWIIQLSKDFRHIFTPIPLFTDNQSFILFSKNDIRNSCTKHIDMHYHYTRNEVAAGNIKLHYIPGIANPTDVLTKALSPCKHIHILNSLRICCA